MGLVETHGDERGLPLHKDDGFVEELFLDGLSPEIERGNADLVSGSEPLAVPMSLTAIKHQEPAVEFDDIRGFNRVCLPLLWTGGDQGSFPAGPSQTPIC